MPYISWIGQVLFVSYGSLEKWLIMWLDERKAFGKYLISKIFKFRILGWIHNSRNTLALLHFLQFYKWSTSSGQWHDSSSISISVSINLCADVASDPGRVVGVCVIHSDRCVFAHGGWLGARCARRQILPCAFRCTMVSHTISLYATATATCCTLHSMHPPRAFTCNPQYVPQ